MLRRLLSPPVIGADLEKNQRAWLLNAIAGLSIGAAMLMLLIVLIAGKERLLAAAGLVVGALAYLLLRRLLFWGKTRLACYAFLFSSFGVISAAIYSAGSIRAPYAAGLILLVIFGWMLFKARGGALAALLASSILLGFGLAENAGLLPEPAQPVALFDWAAYSILFALASALSRVRAQEPLQRRMIALQMSEARFQALFEQAHDAVFLSNLQGQHTRANRRALEMLGYTMDEFMRLTVQDIYVEAEQAAHSLARVMAGEVLAPYESLLRRKDGETLPVEVNLRLARGENGSPLHIQCVARDISERKNAEAALQQANQALQRQLDQVTELKEQLYEQSLRDPLTGLYNRRYLYETLPRETVRARREQGCLSMILLDIDHLKDINDTHGREAGDAVLKAVADLVTASTRGSDICCRYGGDEFLLILPGASLQGAQKRAEQIRNSCHGMIIANTGADLQVTLSLGVAGYPDHGRDLDEIISKADLALHASKQNGRNQVTVSEQVLFY